MRLSFTLLFVLLSCSLKLQAQSVNDTAQTPYWIDMMQDRSVNFYQTQRAFELYWQNRSVDKGSGWKVFKRWEWLAERIIDSAGNFPAYEMQFQDMLDQIKKDNDFWDAVNPALGPGSAACKTQGDWKSLGPTFIPTNNTGQINGMGRVNAIAFHPTDTNTIFVGSPAGGIWKTTDGGATWSVNTDSLPTLGVSAIAINPSNPSIMYFGSGDRDAGDAAGYGVFKSTNSGATWSISNTGMGNRTVGKLIIDPVNPTILLAACNGGIYRSTNSGANWTQTYSGGFFKDIVFKPNNSNVVYATKDGLLYRSTDNGQSWSALTTGLPTTAISRAVIDVSSLNPSLVYFWIANGSVHKGIYLSRDSGNTFRTQSTTPNIHDYSTNGSGTSGQAWYNMDMVVDPGNEAIIYCGGVNVFRSNDTGKTWTIAGYWVNQIHADQHELVANPITNRIFAGNDGGLYASRNNGVSWTPLKSGLGIAQVYKLDVSRQIKDIVITGFQDNGTANYNEGWYTTRGGDGMDCAVDQTDSRYSYGELYYGSIFRVFNVNAQATIAQNGYIAAGSDTINESGAWVTPFVLKEGSGNTMYIGYKNIWRSDNIKAGTVQWKKISNNLGGTNSVNFAELESNIANPDILYASRSNGTLYRSDNVNASSPSWNTITQPASGVIYAIETDPRNQNVVYASVSNRVYRSTNKGASWTQVASNLAANVSSILLDTSNLKRGIYVGTNGGGVWYTDTTLNTWRYFAKGLPNTVNVTDLKMYYEPTPDCKCNVIYGSTYNRGTWYSTIYHDGTSKPIAKLNTYDTVICKSNSITFKDKSCYNPTRFKWQFTPGANFINGSDSSTANASVSFPSSGKYNFKFMAENCIGTDTMTGFVIIGDTLKAACIPNTTNSVSGLGIFKVEIASLTRLSSGRNPEGAYVDLACSKVIRLQKGKKYVLRVTTGSTYTEQVKAFIDYNNDGDMVDGGELVYQPTAALANHVDTITIPSTASTDAVLRFRIRSDYISIGTNPCSNLNYGQTEDYGIYIESGAISPKFVTSASSICQGQTVVFTDSTQGNGVSYSWNFGAGASPASATGKGPFTVRYSTTGYKKATLTVDGVSYAKDSAVQVLVAPNIDVQMANSDSDICRYERFELIASDANSSGATYQWYKQGAAITDSTANKLRISSANFSDSGNFSLIATKGSCKDTAYQLVFVRPLPETDFTIDDSTQCLSSNLFSFTDKTTISSGSYSNQWSYGDNVTDTNKSAQHAYTNYGTYSVKLKSRSTFGCVDSVFKSVYAFEMPVASISVNQVTQCFNVNGFKFGNSSSLNSGKLNYNWFFGDGGSSTDSVPPIKHFSSYQASYKTTLIVYSDNNCFDSANITVYLNPSPVAGFSVNDTDQCFNGNGFAFISNASISNGTYSSLWQFGDAQSSNAKSPTHIYNNHGTYQVYQYILSGLGCGDTFSRSVTVFPSPAADFSISDSTQCLKGNQVNFTENGSIAAGSYSIQWDFGDGDLSSNSNPSHNYLKDSIYLVKMLLLSDKSCSDSMTKPVQIYTQVIGSVSLKNNLICFDGHNFELMNQTSIDNGSYNCQWDFGDGTSSNAISPGFKQYAQYKDTYSITLLTTTNNNCLDTFSTVARLLSSPYVSFTINDTVQCFNQNDFAFTSLSNSDNGTINLNWSFGDGNVSGAQGPSHKYNNYGNYTVKLVASSSPQCQDSVQRIVVVNASPDANISALDSISCFIGNSFTFQDLTTIDAGSFSTHFDYGDGSSASSAPFIHKYSGFGDYTVSAIVTSSEDCIDTASLEIKVLKSPSIALNINDTSQCLKGNGFVFTASSDDVITNVWTIDGNVQSTVTSVINRSFSTIGAHKVNLVVKNSDDCENQMEREVQVLPQPNVTITGDTTVCKLEVLTLVANSTQTNQYQWLFNGSETYNGGTLNRVADTTGSFAFMLASVNSYDCRDTFNGTVRFNPLPVPIIDIRSEMGGAGIYTIAANEISGKTYMDYNWTANNGSSSNLPEFLLGMTDTATLLIGLRVTDENGCVGSVSKLGFYRMMNKLYFPNAFTPNNDALNEEFMVFGAFIYKSYSIKIMNRWGVIVYASDDPKKGWDGYYKGELVPRDVYLVFIELEDINGEKQTYTDYLMIRLRDKN